MRERSRFVNSFLTFLVRLFGWNHEQGTKPMDVTIADAKLQKLCNNAAKLNGKYGPRLAGLIRVRMADLTAAETLADMRSLPGRCHELTADLSGHLALDLISSRSVGVSTKETTASQRKRIAGLGKGNCC